MLWQRQHDCHHWGSGTGTHTHTHTYLIHSPHPSLPGVSAVGEAGARAIRRHIDMLMYSRACHTFIAHFVGCFVFVMFCCAWAYVSMLENGRRAVMTSLTVSRRRRACGGRRNHYLSWMGFLCMSKLSVKCISWWRLFYLWIICGKYELLLNDGA